LLTGLLTGCLNRIGEDVGSGGLGGADHVGVDAKCDCGIRVAEPCCDDVDGDA
jgi:hypothetical protein